MDSQKSRIQLLRERVEAAEKSKDRSTTDVPFRGSRLPFVKIKVKTSFPLYRIQSGRTHRAQSAYLESHPELPKSFFDDPEDERVQQAQHGILLQKIREKDLDADLRDRKQHSAIILTYDGFIVDGNRRIAALREAKEEYVTAVVLPKDATSGEIFETELELQMSQDTKAPYNWVDELVHIRYGSRDLKEGLDQIAKRMRRSKDAIKEAVTRLQYVDSYLQWLGSPRQYHRVPENAEQAFGDLALRMNSKGVQKLTEPAKNAINRACFAAIQAEKGYEAIRTIVAQLSKAPQTVVSKLKDEAGADLPSPKANRAPSKSEKTVAEKDPLLQLAAAEIKATPQAFSALGDAFSTPERSKKLVTSLVRVASDLAEEERESKRQTKPVELIDKAVALLEKVEIPDGQAEQGEVAKALARLDEKLKLLTKRVERSASKKAP